MHWELFYQDGCSYMEGNPGGKSDTEEQAQDGWDQGLKDFV